MKPLPPSSSTSRPSQSMTAPAATFCSVVISQAPTPSLHEHSVAVGAQTMVHVYPKLGDATQQKAA
jgi:hypothetical protein